MSSPSATPSAEPHWLGPACGLGAYGLWGLLPLYIKLLGGVPPLQLLAHRVVWSLLLMLVLAAVLRRWRGIAAAARGRTLLMLLASAALICSNWLIYIWAIQGGHVLEASLGYFVNPLVNVGIAVALLGERLRRAQALAIAIAALGVLAMALLSGGGALWVSLGLAFTFALYGLVRKFAAIDALGGLLVETALLGPLATAYLVAVGVAGAGSFGAGGRGADLLLILAGPVTAAPLLLFAAAARRLRFSTLGLFQYVSPTLQFLLAVLLFGEVLRTVHVVAFACIWTGLAIYVVDSMRAARFAPPPIPE